MRLFASMLGLFIALSLSATANSPQPYTSQYMGTPETFTYEELVELITRYNLRSIEDVLAKLPEAYRQHFVLMYRSQSLQGASFDNPRVIFFGSDGSLLMSFNGNKKQKGFNKLEVIQFRPSDARFEFREIDFSKKRRPKFSDANPAKCLECHQGSKRIGADSRPNWEPYSFWPGAYGSHDGYLYPTYEHHKFLSLIKPEEKKLRETVRLSAQEPKEYELFWASAHKHPRYKHIAGFLDRRTPHNNILMTERIQFLNLKRVMRLMRENPVFEHFKYNLYSLVLFQTPQLSQPVLLKHTAQTGVRFDSSLGEQSVKFGEGLRLIFEPLGIDTSDWSTDFKTQGRFALAHRFGLPGSPYHAIRSAFENANPDLVKNQSRLPELLNSKLRSDFDFADVDQEFSARELLNRCARCHESPEDNTPVIHFSDEPALSRELRSATSAGVSLLEDIETRTKPNATKPMPPGEPLTDEEREALLNHLRSLKP